MAQCSSTEFYVQGSFVDNKVTQANYVLPTEHILPSLALWSEQYPPVASTQVLKSLKCRIKINTSFRPYTDSSQLCNQHEYIPGVLVPWLLCTSDFAAQTVRGAQAETPEFNCLRPPIVTALCR